MGFEEIDQNYLFHYQCFMAKAVSGICREDVRNYGDSCVYSDVSSNCKKTHLNKQFNMSKIPVFISCPTTLNKRQNDLRSFVVSVLDDLNMEARALGRSDYPKDFPLKEVTIIAKRCSGGIILGFEQIRVSKGKVKVGTVSEKDIASEMLFPTQLLGTILKLVYYSDLNFHFLYSKKKA